MPPHVLNLCVDGVIVGREFEPYEEAIDVIGEALRVKEEQPYAVVTILVTDVGFQPPAEQS